MNIRTGIRKGIVAGTAVSVMMMTVVTFGLVSRSAGANTVINGPRDCDNNAVIRCGALSTDELKADYQANEAGDVPAIYQHFGISSADVAGLSQKATVGTVKANGEVWIGDQLIGVNARTAGRNKTTHSVAILGSSAYVRPPSDSFASPSTTIQVFVGYKNTMPAFAIISSCGNPLIWDKPNFDVQKTVSKDGASWKENETFKDGDQAQFRLVIKETTGRADIGGVSFTDFLPTGATYVPNSLKIDGIASSKTVGQQVDLAPLKKGSTVTITYKTTVKVTGKECGTSHLTNTVHVGTLYFGTGSDTASVDVSKECAPAPTPKYSCQSLTHTVTANTKKGDSVQFKATPGVIENTQLTGYTFSINGSVVQDTASDTYTYTIPDYGTYAAEVRVKTEAGVSPSTASCKATFTVEQPAPEPKYVACTALSGPETLKVGQKGTYTVSTSDESRVASYKYTLNGAIVSGSGKTFDFTPESDGTYTIAATIVPVAGVTDNSNAANCKKTVKVEKEKVVSTQCKSLSASVYTVQVGGSTKLTATAQASNTTVQSYVFSVDGTEVQNSAANTYTLQADTAGTHTVKVEVIFANGDRKSSADCEKTITVAEKPVEIVTVCEALEGRTSLKVGEKATYRAITKATGTTVEKYEFEVDGQKMQSGDKAEYEYVALKGAHTIRVMITFANGDVKTSTDCQKTVKGEEEPKPEKEIKVCRDGQVVPIKESDKRSTDKDAPCPQVLGKETEKAPELPNTGAAAETIAGAMTALAGAGTMAHRKYTTRKRR